MLSLHGGAGTSAEAGDSDKTSGSHPAAPDPLCLNNASLHALQNLRPWADDNATAVSQHSQREHDDDDSNDSDSDDDDDDVSDGASEERDVESASAVVQLQHHQQQSASRPTVHELRQLHLTAV